MTDLIEKDELRLSRLEAARFFQENGFEIESYSFEIAGQKVLIKHFGEIEIEGEIYNFIDFMDRYFTQKRSTIINNVVKTLGIKKPEDS